MSIKYEDYIKQRLLEAIEKEKLQEKKTVPTNEDPLITIAGIDKKKYKDIKTDLKFPDAFNPKGFKKQEDFVKKLKKLLKKNPPNDVLSKSDIESATEEELMKVALEIAAGTTDTNLSNKIYDILRNHKIFKDTFSSPQSGTVAAATNDRDIDIEDIQSITYPNVTVSDASLGAGKFLGSQNDLINSIFSAGTIKERCEQFSKVSEAVFKAAEDNSTVGVADVRKIMQYTMFIDLCNSYFNLMDGRSVGYSFEALCAIICGGQVIGGSNGAADFKTNDGALGSSKKYSNWASISQAASGFDMKNVNTVHYVIGIPEYIKVKGLKEDTGKDKTKFSDPESRVASVKIYYIVVNLVEQQSGIGTFVTSDPKGNPIAVQELNMGSIVKVDIIKNATPDRCLVGEFKLYSGQNSFKSILSNKAKSGTDDYNKAYKKVAEYFKLMKIADESSRKYINQSSTNPQDILKHGNDAMENMTKADSALEEMLKLLKPEGSTGNITNTSGTRTISESKQLIDVIKELAEKEINKKKN